MSTRCPAHVKRTVVTAAEGSRPPAAGLGDVATVWTRARQTGGSAVCARARQTGASSSPSFDEQVVRTARAEGIRLVPPPERHTASRRSSSVRGKKISGSMYVTPAWRARTSSRNFGTVSVLSFASPAPSDAPCATRGRIERIASSRIGLPGTDPNIAPLTRPFFAVAMKKSTPSRSSSIGRRHSKSVSTWTPPIRQMISRRKMSPRSQGARSRSADSGRRRSAAGGSVSSVQSFSSQPGLRSSHDCWYGTNSSGNGAGPTQIWWRMRGMGTAASYQ